MLSSVFILLLISTRAYLPALATGTADGLEGLQPKISVGFVWEHPRHEKLNVKVVKVSPNYLDLRLICQLNPPLPKTKNNFLLRNDIVQWNKVSGVSRGKFTEVYWSDDQSITAVAFKTLRPRHLGNYSCSFMSASQAIHLTAENLHDVSHMPKPENFDDFEGLALNLEDKSGLEQIKLEPQAGLLKYQDSGISFSCNVDLQPSQPPAMSVHSLRPADVKVMYFIGGSIASGVAADAVSVYDLFKVTGSSLFRSDPTSNILTFPGIFEKFSPNIKLIRLQSQMNSAAYGLYMNEFSSQVNEVITSVKTDKEIDFERDWKLITISLDFDNLCHACADEDWASKISLVKSGLDRLASEVPKTFINLVLPPNVTLLTKYRELATCPPQYRRTCSCMKADDLSKEKAVKYIEEFSTGIVHLVEKSMRYHGRSDFVVVVQPLWSHVISLGREEIERVFAKDCYHLSSYGHQSLAVALWNNMLEPIYSKNKVWKLNPQLRCPTQSSPFFFTSVNSARIENLDKRSKESSPTSSAPLRVGLGTLAGITIIFIVLAIIVYKSRRRAQVGPAIRVLAQPWKRTKLKV